MVMAQSVMAGQRFSPGPGKTAPRLVEDLLDYDLRNKNRKAGKSLLADPAPHFYKGTLPTLRKEVEDCRHTLMWKHAGKEGSAAAPQSSDERPNTDTKYDVDTYCPDCKYHFEIKVSFESLQEDRVICHLKDINNPMHHFRLKSTMKKEEWEQKIGSENFKYDPLLEAHTFVCTAPFCPATVEIRISPPRIQKKLLNPIIDPARLYQRGKLQIQAEPERYAGHPPATVYAALGYFRQYLHDARNLTSGEEMKRIAKRNKKYMLAFGEECAPLFEYAGFKTIEGEIDADLKPTQFWQPPLVTDTNRKFINDIITELELYMRKNEPDRPLYIPIPALKDIERSLGYHGYLMRKRTINIDAIEHPYYASLGAREDFTDRVLEWAYDRQRECDPQNRPYYLDCLSDLAKGRGSEELETRVAMAVSGGQLGLQAIRQAYKYFSLDPNSVEGDDHIIGLYKSRIESAPRQKDDARQNLRVIAQHRESAKIESVANDRTMSYEEALEFLNVTADVPSDSIEASAVSVSLDADKSRVASALRVIANHRGGDYTLTRAAAAMESGSGESVLDLGEAYARLQIQERSASDETVWMYYSNLAPPGVAPGSKDSYSEALRVIALDRRSNYLLQKLGNPDAIVESTTAEPLGIDNIGNTCYLNSLLQYFYTVKPVRNMVMDFDNYRMVINEENLKKKRAGGRLVKKAEIIKAQKFVDELHDLFEQLKTASTRSVKPTKELAELTIFSTEKEETYRRKSISSPQGPPTISSVLEGAVFGPQWPPPSEERSMMEPPPIETLEEDVEMKDRPTDKDVDTPDNSSEATLVDFEQPPQQPPRPANSTANNISNHLSDYQDGAFDDKMALDSTATENATDNLNDLEVDAVMVNSNDVPINPPQNSPPAVPPRNKSGLVISTNESKPITTDNDFWRFGVQQDVTEVIDNVMFRFKCAIKPTSFEAGSGEQVDQVTNAFFGANASYLEKPGSLNRTTEPWSYLSAFPAAAGSGIVRDLYEAMSVSLDVQKLAVDNVLCNRYWSITSLPPIVQIQIQRTDYNSQVGSFKNKSHIDFPDTIYLDRFLDTADQDSMLMRRRRETWEWKAQLLDLEARQSALLNSKGEIPVGDALCSLKEYFSNLQEQHIEGIDIDPALQEALDERLLEVNRESEELAREIVNLKDKLKNQFNDLTEHEYKLQAVFIHRGEAGGGHYWIYIYDFEREIWREYNDENVTVVRDLNRIYGDHGSAGTPYLLSYIRSNQKSELVDAVCREVQEIPMELPTTTDIDAWAGNIQDDEGVSMQDNDGWAYDKAESSHIEHAAPRPLRPKPASAWEADWPPASDGLKDAHGHDWS